MHQPESRKCFLAGFSCEMLLSELVRKSIIYEEFVEKCGVARGKSNEENWNITSFRYTY